MKKALICALVIGASAFVLSGCSVGNMPSSPSPDEIKKTIASKKPEEQIALIEHSPMPPAQKEAKIAEIKAKYNMK